MDNDINPSFEETRDIVMSFIRGRCPRVDAPILEGMIEISILNLLKFTMKHDDYGRGNVQAGGEIGLLHRIRDKIERLVTLHFKRQVGVKPNYEAIEDSIRDMAVHALMLQVVREGIWPDVDSRWEI